MVIGSFKQCDQIKFVDLHVYYTKINPPCLKTYVLINSGPFRVRRRTHLRLWSTTISRLTKRLQMLHTQWAYPVGPVPVYGPGSRRVEDGNRVGPHGAPLAALHRPSAQLYLALNSLRRTSTPSSGSWVPPQPSNRYWPSSITSLLRCKHFANMK